MIKQLLAVVLLVWTSSAMACSCAGDNAGFVHADVKRLPSNARGALFLPPSGSYRVIGRSDDLHVLFTGEMAPLSPASFTITADNAAAPLTAQLSWPDLSRPGTQEAPARYYKFVRKADEARALRVRTSDIAGMVKRGVLVDRTLAVNKAERLLRVGPVGGFKPGVRYTISYLGMAERWVYPASVVHEIDAAPLASGSGQFKLVLDGPPLARMLPLVTFSGACSSNQSALVQDFHYALPAGHAAYEGAVIYLSEKQTGKAGGYQPIYYVSSMCGNDRFMSTASAGGKDVFYAQCKERPAPASIRGWAGVLEVEDRLHPTNAARVDLGSVAGGSCTGIGMLGEALGSGNAARIKQTVCSLEGELSTSNAPFAESLAGFPAAAFFSLFSAADGEVRQCARQAAIRIFNETSVLKGPNLARYASLIRQDLKSADPKRVAMVANELVALNMDIRHTRSGPEVGTPIEALLSMIVDDMVYALIGNRAPETTQLAALLQPVKSKAAPHVPALLKAADGSAAGTGNAMLALEVLIGADPRLLQLLVDNAKRPLWRETAALAYHRLAGKKQPDTAIKLLIDAVPAGGTATMAALSAYGARARAAVPVLLEKVQNGSRDTEAFIAITVLLRVSDADPRAMRAFSDALAGPASKRVSDYAFSDLALLGESGRVLLPALEMRMREPMSDTLKQAITESVATMRLPAAQRADLLARLAKVPLLPNR